MAVGTKRFTLTNETWVAVATGADSVSVISDVQNATFIHVGSVPPALNTPDYLILTQRVLHSINLSELNGANVWARAAFPVGSEVVVLAEGL